MPRRTNGEGTIYKRTDGRWCARYTFNNKRRDITGKTQAEVKRKLKATLAELEKASKLYWKTQDNPWRLAILLVRNICKTFYI